MPVSGRPVKAALLKMTHGSSEPEVKGFQKSASGPEAGRVAGDEGEASDCLRVQSRAPSADRETMRQTSRTRTAKGQRGAVCAGSAGESATGRDGCGSSWAWRASNTRW